MPTVSPGLPTGKVIGRFLFMSQDQEDAGSEPDYLNVTGTVKFTCSANGPLQVSSMNLVLIPLVFEATFDSEGYLIPVGDTTLTRGIYLPASSSTVYNPHDFTWKVSFDIRDTRTGLIIKVDPFNVYVTQGVDNDISTQVPVTGSGGVPIVRGETGPTGPYTDITIGTITTGTPGSAASASLTGPSGTKSLNIAIPQGLPGDVSAWKTGVPYVVNQVIANPSGDMVKCTTAHTSGASYDASKFLLINKGLNDALYAPISHTHTASQISDSTAVGRSVVTAADAAAARTAIGAMVSTRVYDYSEITGTVPTAALPPLAINDTFTAATQAAMLALTAQRGDIAIRTDTAKTYILSTDSPGTLADWKELLAAGQVTSVAGKSGVVSLVKADVGLGNVDNTADSAKPVSTVQQTALDLKAPLASPAFTGTPTGITKTHVGLGNVDNTSDVNKPVSTAQSALFVPRWKASTVYAAGDPIITPRGEAAFSKTARTSGTTFNGAEAINWNVPDQSMTFINAGFSWSGGGANWDCGPLSIDTGAGASSQTSGASFAAPGGLSGELTLSEPGIYDAVWDNQPNADPGQGGYRVVSSSGSWPGPIDAAWGRFGQANRIAGQRYWESKCVAVGIRVPIANLSIRFTGLQDNATTNIARIKIIKRASL